MRYLALLPIALLTLVALLIAGGSQTDSAHAQTTPDLSGPWPITVETTSGPFVDTDRQCIAEVVQTGGGLSGKIQCSGLGISDISGTVDSLGAIAIVSGDLGTGITWSGTMISSTSGSGTWFSNVVGDGGTWSAKRCGTTDSDGDGLLDCWESGGIDFDADTDVDLKLDQPPFNADPDRIDIFVEIDYMMDGTHSHLPKDPNFTDVVNAFAAAPVGNPTGPDGITLHPMVDEPVPELPFINFEDGAFDQIKSGVAPCGPGSDVGHFGTVGEREDDVTECPSILAARRMVFHYVIFAHAYDGPPFSGYGEVGGNDFMVTHGGFTEADFFRATPDASLTPTEREVAAEAGTFMHELGHNLNLAHGGNNGQNCKPNYLSVMNYTFQTRGADVKRPLDYSRQLLQPLDEAGLNEVVGIASPISGPLPAGWSAVYGVADPDDPPGDALPTGGLDPADDDADGLVDRMPRVEPIGPNIDWNDSGSIDSVPVPANLNNFGGALDCRANSFENFTGYNDWENLRYNFRDLTDFAAGLHLSTVGLIEIDTQFIQALAENTDFDGDGVANAFDNCPSTINLNQDDADGDGIGNLCESVGGIVELRQGSGNPDQGKSSPASGPIDSEPVRYMAMVVGAGLLAVAILSGLAYAWRRSQP